MAKREKNLSTIGFRIYLYTSAHAQQTGKGHVVLLDEHGRQSYGKAGKRLFGDLDEIPRAVRLLIRDVRRLRRKLHENWWEFSPK